MERRRHRSSLRGLRKMRQLFARDWRAGFVVALLVMVALVAGVIVGEVDAFQSLSHLSW